ncbi:MAG: hypothetical protein ABSD72_16275 [Terracidiphilus sp.]|jgi:hypothetical protein
MSCCGKKREELRRVRATYVPSSFAPMKSAQNLTPVVFKGSGSYLVTGEHSRNVYHFSREQAERSIDAKDAEALLRTGLFQVKG